MVFVAFYSDAAAYFLYVMDWMKLFAYVQESVLIISGQQLRHC